MKRYTLLVQHQWQNCWGHQGRVTFGPPSYCQRLGIFLMTILIYAGISIAAIEVPEAVSQAEQQRIGVIARASTASVSVYDGSGHGGGSAVVITADGFALSNYHVTSPSGVAMKCSLPDGKIYDAVVVGLDPTGDVALIKLLGREDFPHATLGDSDAVGVGDWCFTVGNPFLLSTDFQPSVSYGIVSGVHRYQYPSGTLLEYTDCIQTDAAINPGNSGGALFDAQGHLIGINGRGSFEKRGRVNVGVGYAISINQIKKFMGYLRSGRIVDHATLGATVLTDEEGHVIISNILESSDASRRGLQYGDELVSFAGRTIGSVNTFKNVLGTLPRGWKVPLSYRRDGKRYVVRIRLAGLHRQEELLAKAEQAFTPPPNPGRKKPGQNEPHNPPSRRKKNQAKTESTLSKEVAKYYQTRRGYANYYFNLQNNSRVWQSFLGSSDFTSHRGSWTAKGELNDGRVVRLLMESHRVQGEFGRELTEIDTNLDLGSQLVPRGSGGFLAALHIWQRMLVEGPSQFGDVYYLGTAPIDESSQLCDVLVATHNVIESWFYFDPEDGRLRLVEMFSDREVDPCEVYFDDYRDVGACRLPHQLQIRHGDGMYGELAIENWLLPEEEEDGV